MANLPNLTTADISVIAYWELGVNVTKADFLGVFESFTEYDNGIDGVIRISPTGALAPPTGFGFRVQARVRTDGLLIAYALRANEPADGVGASLIKSGSSVREMSRGFLLVTELVGFVGSTTTLLAKVLNLLEDQTAALGKTAVVEADVNYYDFEHPDANTWYVRWRESNSGSGTFTEPASGTTVHAVVLMVSKATESTTTSSNLNSGALVVSTNTLNAYACVQVAGSADVAPVLQAKTVANDVAMTIANSQGGAGTMLFVEE